MGATLGAAPDPAQVKGLRELGEDYLRLFSLDSILRASQYVPILLNKPLLLLKRSESIAFYLGDNPVGMQNKRDFGAYGNIGLAVPGIEIYLPISSFLTLSWFCPSDLRSFRDGLEEAREIRRVDPAMWSASWKGTAPVRRFVDAADSGRPFTLEDEAVVNLRALQVYFAERYVFAAADDFDLARETIERNAKLRGGPRMSVG